MEADDRMSAVKKSMKRARTRLSMRCKKHIMGQDSSCIFFTPLFAYLFFTGLNGNSIELEKKKKIFFFFFGMKSNKHITIVKDISIEVYELKKCDNYY